ncbi:Phospho-2-dehydro-3-deoxyheptonate aldolase [Smittium culicis]|uniref:Phospho-2-dehydro-3-deoxyheptonate aldolase n=1 Tax=Smittium culicis TaxID=133412 RepID=A0A1R1XRG0_9FUNG|nr:Phospho-2-dehydro-3-deoxyheptonate aldolase [Smittium culicis]
MTITGSVDDNSWSPDSWRDREIKHNVEYNDAKELNVQIRKLKSLPPLVPAEEIENLRKQLAKASQGEMFLLMGGDCAETFESFMIWGMRIPVIRVARMAGQYAKPRSSNTEVVDGNTVLTFRGEILNGMDVNDRNPDPKRLVEAYFHSATTMNYIRSLLGNNFADLNFPHNWNLEWVKNEDVRQEYSNIIKSLADSFDFMKTIGNNPLAPTVNSIDFFTAHEGLVLEYEEALTRKISPISVNKTNSDNLIKNNLSFSSVADLAKKSNSRNDNEYYYNTSAHFLWIGDRTRQIDGAHVEYFRNIRNPIGVKVGPTMKPEELVRILDILDSNFEDGRVTLITRYGAKNVDKNLPAHIRAVQGTRHKVVWCCDPCHGNTVTSPSGLKTRNLDDITTEIKMNIITHNECNSKLNGVHLELTGDYVTECIGGSEDLEHHTLPTKYKSFCDPRLNYLQSLDIAFMISKYFQKGE